VSEHDEQAALIAWAEYQANVWPDLKLLFAAINGAKLPWKRDANGRRFSREAMRLKAEGLKAGVPDLWLPVARGGYHGLVIEMKFGSNRPSNEQLWWLEALAGQGWQTAVCWSFEAAQRVIMEYLAMENDGTKKTSGAAAARRPNSGRAAHDAAAA